MAEANAAGQPADLEAGGSASSSDRPQRTWNDYWAGILVPENKVQGGQTTRQVSDIAQDHEGYHPAAWEEEAEARYATALEAACSEEDDFRDLTECGFLSVPCEDLYGRPVVFVVPQKLPQGALAPDAERLYRFVIQRLDPEVSAPYSVVYVHSDAAERHARPNVLQLRSMYERLPVKYKMRLQHFFVLHSDMTLWVSTSAVCPFLSHGFWGKMRFMQRVEMLWDHIDKAKLAKALPQFVKEHDAVLEEHPLHDYGYVKPDIGPVVPGLDAPPL